MFEDSIVIKDFEEYCSIVFEENPEWELIQKDTFPHGRGTTDYYVLLKYKKNNKYYGFNYNCHYDEGIQDYNSYPLTVPEVEVEEIIKYKWKNKK